MNRRGAFIAGIFFAASSVALAQQPPPLPGMQTFTNNCQSCHGNDLRGGRGPSLFSEALLSSLSNAQIKQIVKTGIPGSEMPSFAQLNDDEISQVTAYLHLRAGQLKANPPFVPNPDGQVIHSQKQTFKIEVIASGLETPWGETFLPDGRMLISERTGALRVIDHGRLLPEPVSGTPKVFVRQDGGLLDVAAHGGWIYLSYTEVEPGVTPAPGSDTAPNPAPPTMTVLVRGHIQDNQWVDSHELFRAPSSLYTTTSDHYGSRFLFDGKG